MLLFDDELYENFPDMLIAALKAGKLNILDVFNEMKSIDPEKAVQIVMDYGDPSYIADCFLNYKEVSEQ